MSYRDDREALLHRVEALERELAQARKEGSAAREEVDRLRAEEAEETEAVEEEPAAAAPAPPLALVPVKQARELRSLAPLMAAGTVALGWTALAAAVGAAAWMLPAVVISAAVAGRLARRDVRVAIGELEKRWPSLPIDVDAYRDLLALPRRTVVVRVAVAFERAPSRSEREKLRQRVRGLGPVSWDQGMMTIASGTLRTGKGSGGAEAWIFDPEVIRTYCARVFDALVGVHAQHPIANVWPRARSR